MLHTPRYYLTRIKERKIVSKVFLLFNMDKRTPHPKIRETHTSENSWGTAIICIKPGVHLIVMTAKKSVGGHSDQMDTPLAPTTPTVTTIPATTISGIRSGFTPAIASAFATIVNDRNDHTDTVQRSPKTRTTATPPKVDCRSVSFHADFDFAPTGTIEWA